MRSRMCSTAMLDSVFSRRVLLQVEASQGKLDRHLWGVDILVL